MATTTPERPNKAPEPTTMAVTIRAPSSTARASHGRGSSLTLGNISMKLIIVVLFSLSLFPMRCVADGPPPRPDYVGYSLEGRFIVRLGWDAKALKAKIQLFELA